MKEKTNTVRHVATKMAKERFPTEQYLIGFRKTAAFR
jgi:hypothetical protein